VLRADAFVSRQDAFVSRQDVAFISRGGVCRFFVRGDEGGVLGFCLRVLGTTSVHPLVGFVSDMVGKYIIVLYIKNPKTLNNDYSYKICKRAATI
jgi:hypothetical protein